ncbi:ABC-type glycerol-3-phosphate transport system, substrate-binding protein [Fontibacillus panacisegetis]|uniref:ABC-type glycerol-3-phosphate transport system, substrate-binding protein n=1 Tax=Fontibacillus panacisegetis TaxID=670482 RepID=A0A1G7K9I9_9BACL|nr:extracellular solute-binding protein [Fontibacillus panacisegetis]SDF33903.1 ABC-type glycerol-3-phosphate transport system, substrate-binding protein [Fontibacillus panacisegetis]
MKNRMILFLAVILLLAGCSPSAETESIEGKQKILYWDDKMFDDDYGSFVSTALPELDYEIVYLNGGTTKELIDYVKQKNPDVIFMRNHDEYLQFIEAGMLAEIDTLIKREHYDISSMHQGVIDMLRNNEEKKLYGLSPTFSNMVLFYNKDLFDTYRIDEPQDQMTWDEVFSTVSQFHNVEGVYGFSDESSAYDLIEIVGKTYSQRIISSDHKQEIQILKDEPFWKGVFEQVNQAVQQHNLAVRETADQLDPELSKKDLFANGYSAITTGSTDVINRYNAAGKKFNLGIVTLPVDPKDPDSAYSLRADTIFGININSNRKQEAWEVIKVINGDTYAKIRSKHEKILYTRTEYSKEASGVPLEPFYKITRNQRMFYSTDLPTEVRRPFYLMVLNELNEMFSDNQSVDHTITNIKEKGEAILKAGGVEME